MKTIWKYSMMTPECDFEMPKGAQILCVQVQNEIPQIWALVDPGLDRNTRRFRTYGTGHDIPENPGKYIGTIQMYRGRLMFHVFEE
jgi:hypothetical protein